MIYDLAKLSGRNLFRRGKRSWLTVIGIIIGITAIVSLFSLGQGLEQSVTGEFQELGANSIYIIPGSGLGGFFGGGDFELSTDDLEAVRRTQGVDVVGPLVNAGVQASFDGETRGLTLVGIPTDESKEMIKRVNAINIVSGTEIRDTDTSSGLAGSRLVDGDVFSTEVRRNSQIRLEDRSIRIKGILEETGDPVYDSSVVMSIDAVREIKGENERIDFIIAEVQSGQSPEKVSQNIEDELRDSRNIGRDEETSFTVSTADDLLNSLTGILDLVQFVVLGITSIALFVGGLGIMNTMYMSVSERTKEIGIMKALGATKKQILGIYLAESAILGLIGGLIGIILGLGLSRLAFSVLQQSSSLPLELAVSPQILILSLVSAVFLGVFSGYLPARKAANLEPVEAIREQ